MRSKYIFVLSNHSKGYVSEKKEQSLHLEGSPLKGSQGIDKEVYEQAAAFRKALQFLV